MLKNELKKAVNIFISYSHRDEQLRQQLDKHLAALKRQKIIDAWHDRKIEAGMNWATEIDDNLKQADLILLLISPDFIFSNYCTEIEMEQAIELHESGKAIVVPIILEPCDWTWLPFSKYQAFPKDAKPITTWTNTNEAFLDVIQGIRVVAERLFQQQEQQRREKNAAKSQYLKKVEEILSTEGEISIAGRDTLDELREELGLTCEEADEIQNCAFEPYKKYKENLQRYEKTFLKIIQQEYPLSNKSRDSLKLRQRDLGIKSEDVEQIESRILAQVKVENTQENVHSLPESAQFIKKNSDQIETQLTKVIEPPQQKIQPIPNPVETALQVQLQSEISTAINPGFLKRCEQELTRYIGPIAHFIIDDILAQNRQITMQQLIDLLLIEIPNPEKAKQFKDALL